MYRNYGQRTFYDYKIMQKFFMIMQKSKIIDNAKVKYY